ncbi:O-antigen ligase family protein [Actinomycetospora sp. C-140]
MSRVLPALLGIAVLAAGAVAAHDLLGARPTFLVLGCAAVAVAALVVLRGIDGLAVAMLLGAVATAPWNALTAGGLKPAPVLLALSLLILGSRALLLRRPVVLSVWVWVLAAAITLVALITLISPPSPAYLSARYVPPELVVAPEAGWPGLGAAFAWLVAVVALPLAVCLAVPLRPHLPGRLANAWALGAAASALVGITDNGGVTHISLALRGLVDVGGREAGLTVQPTHLAVATALALPVVVWRLAGARTLGPVAGWGLVGLVMLGGLVVSESRGGLVAAVAAVIVTLAVGQRSRPWLAPLAVLAGGAAVIAAVSVPDLVGGAAERLRLAGADSAVASNEVRAQLGTQAWEDFVHAPLQGVGLEVALQGHNIWLQLLAAGGALLFLGFLVTFVGVAVDVAALRHRHGGLPLVLGICTATWLAVGVVENHLADLYLYVPFALIAGLKAVEVGAPAATAAAPSTTAQAVSAEAAVPAGGVRP